MGRQAYLTKIALGRSAFEPSQTITQTSEYIQLSSSQQELPAEVRDPNNNRYIQLYDERGNPINPRAHEHGRRLREAQNDVLASIGVVERRRSLFDHLPGSYADRLAQKEDEDLAGHSIMMTTSLARNLSTWWIGSLRARVLVFHFDALPFVQLATHEWRMSGKRLIHAGWESAVLSEFSIRSFEKASMMLRPLDRLLVSTGAGGRMRRFFRPLRQWTRICFHLSLEVLFYPLAYHSHLQRLGLAPARPFFPPLKSFIPFSKSSPLVPYSLHYKATASISNFVLASLTSPFVFICMQHIYARCVAKHTRKAFMLAIKHPENSDFPGPDDTRGDREKAGDWFFPNMQSAIERLTALVGWGSTPGQPGLDQRHQIQEFIGGTHTIEIGGREVTNLSRLELPISQHQDALATNAPQGNDRLTAPVTSPSDVLQRPTTPPSPTASHTRQSEDNNPRIRITSREGIVEIEVRLPPHVLTQHTEVVESDPPTPHHHDVASPPPPRTTVPQTYHRVTQLSLQPSHILASICSWQITNLALLPLSCVGLRLVASHYLATRDGSASSRRLLNPVPSMRDLTWSSIGEQVSRIAFCAALEFALDLIIWSCSYPIFIWTGTNVFGWGGL
ncbi:hypothetical protein CC80DRAFT_429231 [Byssothecium circinans]|uniref:Uncharacterized protein n=1 Tax=Byssothecium circinans TaxID=147558 RepID=A0A6A5T8V9_9PLEO|nr:hypothetical protein CC80DRAFT_429231 [Byssothecium circinans]